MKVSDFLAASPQTEQQFRYKNDHFVCHLAMYVTHFVCHLAIHDYGTPVNF